MSWFNQSVIPTTIGDRVTNPPANIQYTTLDAFFEAMSQVGGWFTEYLTITPESNTEYHIVTHSEDPAGPVYRFRMQDGTQRDVINRIRSSSEFTFEPPEFENLLAVGFSMGNYIQLTVKHRDPRMYVTAVNRHVDPI